MNLLKCALAGLMIISALITPALAHSHPGDPEPIQPLVSTWAQAEVKRAQELGFVPELWNYDDDSHFSMSLVDDYRNPITRAQFRSAAMSFVALHEHYDIRSLESMVMRCLAEKKADAHYYWDIKEAFTDGDAAASVAYYLGLVQGRGNGIFDPDGIITRQEVAVMLTRAYGTYGGKMLEETIESGFTDEEIIADWAKESTVALASWDVMKGMEDGSFSPEGNYSIEQCIVTFLRLYENAPVSRKIGNVTPLFTYEQALEHFAEENLSEIHRETLRVEGQEAIFVRIDEGGIMKAGSSFYFIYCDGGIRELDLGICNSGYREGFTPDQQVENPRFSEDGKTFYCTTTLRNCL